MNEYKYFDYAATTPLDPDVYAAMEPYFSGEFGNPSSIHQYGQHAENAVDNARELIADYLNCHPTEIIFTSCGSESNNIALRGISLTRKIEQGANELITTHVEHHSVSHTVKQLDQYYDHKAFWCDVNEFGIVDLEKYNALLNKKTALSTFMWVNNEIGSINPIQQIAEITVEKGIPFHTDAVQATGYLPIDLQKIPVTSLAIGGHKFYGPKGIGALFLRKGTNIIPSQTGGGQEFGLRAGTHNVPYIVGFAKAIEKLKSEREDRAEKAQKLRDQLISGILQNVPDAKLTGHPVDRLPNHASFVFKGVDGNLLLGMLDRSGFACSSGSACKTGNPEPSEVLTEIGLPLEWALGSLRLTVGAHTTQAMVEDLITTLPDLIAKNRALRN